MLSHLKFEKKHKEKLKEQSLLTFTLSLKNVAQFQQYYLKVMKVVLANHFPTLKTINPKSEVSTA